MRPKAALAGLTVVFLAAFCWQRCHSGFLAVEARAELAVGIAAATGLPTCEVLALHELLGANLSDDVWRAQAAELARLREELGDVALAVLALRGRRPLAERLRREASDDAAKLAELVRGSREAVEDAVRFTSVAARFRARGH